MGEYLLSPQAQQSLQDIHRYTKDTFGIDQTRRDLQQLRDRTQALADQPCLAKRRDDIKLGYYSHAEGSHTTYYRIQDSHIDIIDVLHRRMDAARLLD